MSEFEPGAGTPPVPQASAGQLLKQAREAAGMHVAALAVALKVPVSKLEALEADRFDELPDAVFVRALASSVCRTLRVDAAPILALLPQTQRPHLKADDSGINTPFRAPNERRLRLVPEQWFSPTLLAVPLLCVGALALYLWPRAPEVVALSESAPAQTAPGGAAPESSPPTAEASAPAPVASTGTAATPAGTRTEVVSSPVLAAAPVAPAPAPAAPVAAVPAVAATSVQASKSVAPAPAVTAAVSAPVAAPAAASATAPVPAGDVANSVLSFSASGTSWIKVTDARGVVTLQKTLNAGETASASGQPPFAVVVGKVDVTQLQVRGKAFDLQSVARENVARFEVK